mgnify:CR=1 FL=1
MEEPGRSAGARLVSGIEYVERVHAVPPPLSLPIMLYNFYRWLVLGHRWETEGDGVDGKLYLNPHPVVYTRTLTLTSLHPNPSPGACRPRYRPRCRAR